MGNTTVARQLTEEELELAKLHYATAYILSPVDGDPHGKFAELIGVPRSRAKEISYIFTWTHRCWLFDFLRSERLKKAYLSTELLKERRTRGEKVSMYELLNEAEIYAEVEILKRKQAKRLRGNK